MEKTWASGALELLQHAYSHIEQKSAFDKRMAFISIDNCVEVSIRTFLALPHSVSDVRISKSEIDAVGESFPKLFPDGSVLYVRQGCIVASLDLPEFADGSDEGAASE